MSYDSGPCLLVLNKTISDTGGIKILTQEYKHPIMSLFRPRSFAAFVQRVYKISASTNHGHRPCILKAQQCSCSTLNNRPVSSTFVAPSGPNALQLGNRSISTSRTVFKKSKKSRAAVEEEEEDVDEVTLNLLACVVTLCHFQE